MRILCVIFFWFFAASRQILLKTRISVSKSDADFVVMIHFLPCAVVRKWLIEVKKILKRKPEFALRIHLEQVCLGRRLVGRNDKEVAGSKFKFCRYRNKIHCPNANIKRVRVNLRHWRTNGKMVGGREK